MFISYLGDSKSLLLVDDPQVLFHPLWIQVLDRNGLHFKRIGLEILKIAPKEDRVCRVNFLDAILRE